MIAFIVLRKEEVVLPYFVDFWEQFFEGSEKWPDPEFLAHLKWKGGSLTPEDVRWLFGWKYGKRNLPNWSPIPVTGRLHKLNRLRFRETESIVDEAKELSPTGLVKRFFICHIVSPFKYPIWDQFALRAYLIVSGRKDKLADVDDLIIKEEEYEAYRQDFNRWIAEVPPKVEFGTDFPPFRRLDRALWSMGTYSEILANT